VKLIAPLRNGEAGAASARCLRRDFVLTPSRPAIRPGINHTHPARATAGVTRVRGTVRLSGADWSWRDVTARIRAVRSADFEGRPL